MARPTTVLPGFGRTGKMFGIERAMKGGIGTASRIRFSAPTDGLTVFDSIWLMVALEMPDRRASARWLIPPLLMSRSNSAI